MPTDIDATPPSPPARAQGARVALQGFGEEAPDYGWERAPLYRVVEVVRDGNGRLRREGRIWHTDLDLLRRFGRAVASNAASHKVLIADSQGGVVEELARIDPTQRRALWGGGWQELPLPPCPPVQRAPVRRKLQPAPRPIPMLADPPLDDDRPVEAAAPIADAMEAADTAGDLDIEVASI